MAFQDTNNEKQEIQEQAETKAPAVELAVFNLDSVTHVADHQMIANQVQNFLNICGNTSLDKVKANANTVTVANIYALSGSVLDLLLFSLVPQTGIASVQRNALLAANLIGLFAEPKAEAHTRMALRPMLGLMAECLYPENGKVSAASIRRMELHLNARIAGDLELFLKETQAKLSGLMSSASQLGSQILQQIAEPSITGVAGAVVISGGATAEKRDPTLQFNNWASPLSDLLQVEAQAKIDTKIPAVIHPEFIKKITQASTSLSSELQAQSNAGTQYSLAWLIQQTLTAIQNNENKGKASVPVNQTGEFERHTDGDILEFVSLQSDALNDPSCATLVKDSQPNDSATGHSISYAIGAERVKHTDFYLPLLGFGFSRQYNSQMNEFDNSSMGARWMMPFSNQIEPTTFGYQFIDANGRKHRLPSSILNEAYEVPFEGIVVLPLENGDLALNFGGDWSFHFHQFVAGGSYYLVQQENVDSQESVQLDYLVIDGRAYLKQVDFKLKKAQQALKFAYTPQVKIQAIFIDEQPEPLARYEYDQQGNLVKAYDQNGHVRHYEYNEAHQLTRYTDRTGRGQNICYDSTAPNAKAIQEWADDGSFKTTLKWHPRLRQVAVYDAYDIPTYYYFDLDGFTYRTRLADGREKWLSRDQQKRITRQIDFDGSEIQQIYNEEGQLSKIVQSNGGVIRFAYDEKGNLVETKDPEGNIWKKEYDADGNLSKEINPLGHTTAYKYNPQGQLVEITDAKEGKKSIQYNDLGQMVSYSDCSGKESAWEYDEDGTLKQQQDATSKAVKYIYSDKGIDKGQLKTVIYPDGLKEQFEHDQEGRLLKHTDTAAKVTTYNYNQTGLLAQRVDANKHQIGYHWDKQGRVSTLTNQNHAQYQFHYNQVGQLIREQGFDGEDKYYHYAENGRLFQIKQPLVITQFAYHEDGKIAEKTYTHIETRQTQKESFEYNLNGQLSRASNEISQIDFYRNEIGQLTREHQHYKLPHLKPLTAVLRYQYDELGNLTKTIRPDGQEISHLTYGSGHVYGIALNQKEMVSFKRDDLHRETARYLANGLIQTTHYNDVGLLVSQMIQPEQETTDGLAQSRQLHQLHRQYHYDKNYLLTQVEDSRLGQLKYQYDPIGRLIRTQTPNHTETFNFDPAGNLIDPIATQMSQVKNNLVTQYQGKRYKYDAQGNMLESQEKGSQLKLNWDNLNRLVQSERNDQITEYGYDVFGRRLYKANKTKNSLTLFGWDGDLMIWESHQSGQFNENNSYTKHYLYEPNSFVPLLQGGYSHFIDLVETPNYEKFKIQAYSINKDLVWKNDTRKTKVVLEQLAFYHCDQVGTPQTLSNEKGQCVWEIELNTWGKTQQVKVHNNDKVLEQTNIRFQGQYYDEETGLHYNRYRYYEPFSGKYISKDPIGLEGGWNNLAYVSDPNQWIDPMGLEKTGVLGALFPNTMSAFAKDPQHARALQAQGAMRNNNLGAVAVAGYGPYMIAGGAKVVGAAAPTAGKIIQSLPSQLSNGANTAKAVYQSSPAVQAAVKTSAGSVGIDSGLQVKDMFKCNCVKWDGSRSVVAAGTGAVFGAWGGKMAQTANVPYVGSLSLPKEIAAKNVGGVVIWANQFTLQQASSKALNSATTDKKQDK